MARELKEIRAFVWVIGTAILIEYGFRSAKRHPRTHVESSFHFFFFMH